MILFFFSCAPTQFDEHDWVSEADNTSYFNTDLTNPRQFIPFEDGFLVADSGADAILYVTEGDVQERTTDIDGPIEILNTVPPIVSTTTGIYHYHPDDNQLTPSIEDRVSPSRLLIHDESLCWIEEDQVWTLDGTNIETISTELETPYDLITWNDNLWITTQGDSSIWRYDGSDTIQVTTLDDIPHRFGIANDGLWLTTRSFRWPFGGWIVFFDGSDATKITQSPPEPEHVLAWEDSVVWSSKQSITIYQDDPYDVISIQTTVSSMLLHNSTLFWSDHQGGRIGKAVFRLPDL